MTRSGWRLVVQHVADEQRYSCTVRMRRADSQLRRFVLGSGTAEGTERCETRSKFWTRMALSGMEKRRVRRRWCSDVDGRLHGICSADDTASDSGADPNAEVVFAAGSVGCDKP